jgi:hypothetical protein
VDESPDYRSAKSDSLEGSGIAVTRWDRFHDTVDEDVWIQISEVRDRGWSHEDVPDYVRWDINDSVIEQSELLGFWLAWHMAGGFARLERAGWHRATIHRKIRHFRTFFGKHPDDYRHPWLKLDLEKAWEARLAALMLPVEEP